MKATGISPRKVAVSIDWLMKNGFVQEVKCYTSPKKKSSFYPITEKGHDLLQTPKIRRKPTPRLFKHTFYQHKVGVWLKKKRHEPKKEYSPPGADGYFETQMEGKLIRILDRVDVFALQNDRKVGYEITLSSKNLILNVFKCFIKLNMDEVHIVCETKLAKEKARKMVETSDQLSKLREHHGGDIHYRQISEFL